MSAIDRLIESITADTPLTAGQAEQLLADYPYFTLAASRALISDSLTPAQRARFMQAVALNAPDPDTLMSLVDPAGSVFARFYPPAKTDVTPSTESAIDTFLDTYGHSIDPREQALLERLIFNPTPDYSEVLARESQHPFPPQHDAPLSEQDAMLDAFLSSQSTAPDAVQPQPARAKAEHHPKPHAEAPLSESLAKIFIKRGRYDKAFEIIKQLSLNFPEKSVYFADQLRFLRKLMLNQQYGKAKK